MKLLDKKQIHAIKAKEKQAEINEGIKIAKRVDALREIQAEEEKALAVFRDKTITAINEELTKVKSELNTIKREAEVIEDDLYQKKKELDERRDEYDKWEKKLIQFQTEIHDKRDSLNADEKIIQQTKEGITRDKIRIEGELFEVKRLRNDAETMSAEAKDNLHASRTKLEEVNARHEVMNAIIDNEKKSLKKWEETLSKREKQLIKREEDIANREIRLKDQYIALEQAKNHVKRSVKR